MADEAAIRFYFDSYYLDPTRPDGKIGGRVTLRVHIGNRHTATHHLPSCEASASFDAQPEKVSSFGELNALLRVYEFSDEDASRILNCAKRFAQQCLTLPPNGSATTAIAVKNEPFAEKGFHPTVDLFRARV